MKAKFEVSGRRGYYRVKMYIGVQGFTIGPEWETKYEAKHHIKMLANALKNLDPSIPEPEL